LIDNLNGAASSADYGFVPKAFLFGSQVGVRAPDDQHQLIAIYDPRDGVSCLMTARTFGTQ
jgi:hypothetical protein